LRRANLARACTCRISGRRTIHAAANGRSV
jgi:hypothetical protein